VSEPFIGEIRIVGFNFPPKGWALCNGQILPINQNQALFSVLGTTYGGNGQTTFALPNLQGRAALHWGTQTGGPTYNLGETSGEVAHTLVAGEMPRHTHVVQAAAAPQDNNRSLDGNLLGSSSTASWYAPGPSTTTLNPATVSGVGGSQPHNNVQPYLVLNFVIALRGIFPSRN
jgi:microcystin-dependent protein